MIVPPAVPPGGRIAVIAPASRVRAAAVRSGMAVLRAWGYEPVPGPNLLRARGDLAGSDAERAADLRWAMTARGIDAAWTARGGWGTARLLAALDLDELARGGRWLIGFSDLTALQLALFARGLCSWHAPLVAELGVRRRYSRADLQSMLARPAEPRSLPATRASALVRGRARGPLSGGCLSVIAALAGTPWQPQLDGTVLALEDVGEAPYRIDRLLWQLRAAGCLDGVAGVLFGQFSNCRALPGRPSRPLADILAEHARALGVPALAGLPFGHGAGARALPLGFTATVDADRRRVLLEPPL